jgi:hypothetical protein
MNTTDPNPFADGCTVIIAYGAAKLADKHLASTIRCIDDEIIEWLKVREQRKRDRQGSPGYKPQHLPCPLYTGGLNRSTQHFILQERWSVV